MAYSCSMHSVSWTALILLLSMGSGKAQAQLGRIEVGRPFPVEPFPALKDGRPTSLTDYRGKRVLLLVFASW